MDPLARALYFLFGVVALVLLAKLAITLPSAITETPKPRVFPAKDITTKMYSNAKGDINNDKDAKVFFKDETTGE